jgi:outer membrane protein assembly factor BamB
MLVAARSQGFLPMSRCFDPALALAIVLSLVSIQPVMACDDCDDEVEEAPIGDFVSAEALHDVGLLKHWQLTLPFDGEHELADLYRVDDTLYATTTSGWVFAIQADTGAMRWMRQVTTRGNRLEMPAHAGIATVFPAKSELVLFNRYTGDGLRRVELRFPCSTAPVVDENHIYLGGSNGRFYALNRQDFTEAAKALSTGPIVGDLVLHNGILYVTGEDGGIMSARVSRWWPYWEDPARVHGPLMAGCVVTDDAVYVPSLSQSLFKLERRTGRVSWRHPLSGALRELPIVTDSQVFQYNSTDGLVVLDPSAMRESERIQWTLKSGRQLCTLDESHAYVMTRDGRIVVLRLESGEQVAEFESKLVAPRALTVIDRMALYLYDEQGRIFCAKPTGEKPPTQKDVRLSLLPPRKQAEPAEEAPVVAATSSEADADDQPRVQLSGTALGGTSKVSREWGRGSEE